MTTRDKLEWLDIAIRFAIAGALILWAGYIVTK